MLAEVAVVISGIVLFARDVRVCHPHPLKSTAVELTA